MWTPVKIGDKAPRACQVDSGRHSIETHESMKSGSWRHLEWLFWLNRHDAQDPDCFGQRGKRPRGRDRTSCPIMLGLASVPCEVELKLLQLSLLFSKIS
jgi:hypothetical protein